MPLSPKAKAIMKAIKEKKKPRKKPLKGKKGK